MSGGGGGGGARGAAGPVPASARKLVQGLKEIVNRPDAEIYAALRECDMNPDEAVSRLLSQDTFQEVKSKRDKKKEVKETPEPRSRGTSNNRANRGGAERTGRSSSAQSGSGGTDYAASRSSILGPAVPATNSSQKQTVPSLPANKDVAPNGSVGAPQSSSGFQNGWCSVPGQMSMADIVKMGRPQIRSSSKPIATTDTSYAGQSQNSKQTASTALSTTFDQGFPALPDPVPQTVNSSHASAENHRAHENDWFPQEEPALGTQSTGIETSGDPSLLAANATDLQENSHAEENSPSEEVLEENNQFNDDLRGSSMYQPEVHSYVDGEVDVSNVDAESASTKFQHLSIQNEDTKSAEEVPAVILPDHLQVANADCAHLSFGSFGSGAFSGLLSSNVPQSNLEEAPIPEESPSVNQVDVRNQDYYDQSALSSSANEDVETRNRADMENIDVPSVSEPDVLRQGALDVPGLQYNLPSVSSHAYANTIQPSTIDDSQGNTQAQHLSPFSSLLRKKVLLLLLCLSAIWALAAAEVPLGGCQQERCGNVDIPYPFGITGSGCSLDNSFLIDCKVVGGIEKPFAGPFEVIKISVAESKALVMMNFSWWCGDDNAEQRKVSLLQRSHNHTVFRFSYTDNEIFVIGCEIIGLFVGGDMVSSRYHDSCTTTCIEAPKNNTCNGFGCCKISVKRDLVEYGSAFIKQTKETRPCNYMILTEKASFSFSPTYISNKTLLNSNNGQVPVVLDWAIRTGTCEDYTDYDLCKGNNTVCADSTNGEGYVCKCSSGYEGDPYSKDGCTDIDECIHNPCGGICQNKPGSFTCVCPRGKEMINGLCMKSHKWVTPLIICICIGIVIFVLIIACACLTRERRKVRHIKESYFRQHGGFLLLEEMKAEQVVSFKIFSESELKQATENFNRARVVGHGGQGEVYKGIIRGTEVAIKTCVVVDDCQKKIFGKEMFILSQINHKNIIKLLGCCLEVDVPMLVYEYIPNGTLSQLIHQGGLIPLAIRVEIAQQVAEALAYLHNWASPPILHGDIKSSNILMDQNYTAKVSDFGSSILAPTDKAQFMTRVEGTFGYLDPEYMQTGRLTDKSDVYSFGVVLLELLTRKKALNLQRSEHEQPIVAKFLFGTDEERLRDIDDQIKSEENMIVVIELAKLVKQCLALSGANRPSMKDVADKLNILRKALLEMQQVEESTTEEGEGSLSGAQQNLEHTELLLGSPSAENIRFDEEAVKSLEMGRW